MTRNIKERDWYDIELESEQAHRDYMGSLSPEEHKERQEVIRMLKEPIDTTGGISIQTQQLERIGQFLSTLHCEKGGCIHGECPVWILERLVACEPLGMCHTCDEWVDIPLEKAVEHYQDPNVAIYCCDDCKEAMEGDYSEEEEATE
jgi:hypothetical protein